MKITNQEARRLALGAQGLDGAWQPPTGADGALAVVDRVGYVQIDTISVVQRAHHHIVWTRQRDYRPDELEEAVADGQRLFEWWSWNHTAAYLPVSDYPLYAWHMAVTAESSWRQGWLAEHHDLAEEVLARIRAEGPLGAADFAAPEGFRAAGWWDWKPAKRALDHLFGVGRLLVCGRKGFQRLYDLPERVLPAATALPRLNDAEAVAWLVRRLLGAQGLAYAFGTWRLRVEAPPLRDVLGDMIASGEVVEVDVEGLPRRYYALSAMLAASASVDEANRLRILSPFDPLIIDRRRFSDLFSCDYRLECYLPAVKRRFGYYMLPILWGSEIVGRIDAKAQRRERVLTVHRLELQPHVSGGDLATPLAAELAAYAAFNGCDEVALGEEPAAEQASLVAALAAPV
jgi:uncharacterized protein YcaQ